LLVGDWLSGPILGGCHSPDGRTPSGQHAALVHAPLSRVIVAAISLVLGVFALALIGRWA